MKKIRKSLSALLLCLLLGLSVIPAAANDGATVRVGFFAMQGYHMIDDSGARSGYGYDFLQLTTRYSNIRYEYVGYDKSWEEMQQMLLDGEIDLLTSMQKTPEREKLFGFTDTLIGTSSALLTVKSGDTRYSDGNYDNMRIGMVRGSTRNEQLALLMASRGFSYTPVYFHSMEELTAALQEGATIDAAMTSTLRWSENEWTLEEFEPSPFYAVVRAEDTALLAELNEAIDRMDSDSAGWRTRLMNEYYTMDSDEVVAFTADERAYLDALKKRGRVLSVTMNPDCAPYSYFVDGSAKGIIPDIFSEAAKRMGISVKFIEPTDRSDYQRLCLSGGMDIILDAIDDFYTVEVNGLKITDVYYTAPIAALTTKANIRDIEYLAQPSVSLLNEAYYADFFAEKTLSLIDCDTLAETAEHVLHGEADGTYMPYFCAQWLSGTDNTGKLKCLILPRYERSFTCAVSSGADYHLLSSLNKALGSISDDLIASIVTENTEQREQSFSLVRLFYQNPILVFCLTLAFAALVLLAVFFAERNLRAQRELLRSRNMERYIGYLCDMYYKVLEVDLELHTRRQYTKRDEAVSIEERTDFESFDFDSIHPDDAEASRETFDSAAIRALAASGKSERYVESRMLDEHGEYRWYSFLLKMIPKDDKHPCSAMLLIKDVDDLHRERESSHEALLGALDAANSASRSKSTFLSSMSHEIRTPLNAMIGYMTIASASIADRDKVLHCIDSAGIAARHLLSIINDVLDISSMESGKMKLAKEPFDLKEQLSSITSVFYQQCRQKGIEFTISINSLTEEIVAGDSMRVNQILMNLMSNAVKFTDSGGRVILSVVQTAINAKSVYIRFTVKDTGIGMSEEYLARLFAPFEQESTQTAKKYGGTGLGMSITFNLVNLMGGKIEVASVKGEGSTFTVTLPFERTENAERLPLADFSKLRVLVVDDMENECEYVHELLSRCGVRAQSAGSGEEALRLVAECKDTPDRFDICIIDWNMPELNGVETTRLIHRECDPSIPIIIATAYDIAEFEEEAMAAGAAKIISKPLFQSTLFDLLISICGKYDAVPESSDDIPDLSGMRVLLAEDNEMNIEVAVELLELAGVSTEVARDGSEALAKFLSEDEKYDVILMDVMMPVMDGYAATKAIRESASPRAKTIPIIAMTANALAEDVSASLASGMNGHLSKPIETQQLYSVLMGVNRK